MSSKFFYIQIILLNLCLCQQMKFVKIDIAKEEPTKNLVKLNSNETTTTTVSTTPASISTTLPPLSTQNNTIITNTQLIQTTTPVTISTPSPLPQNDSIIIRSSFKGYFCECDLKFSICDINCCCDKDCNQIMLKSFTCENEQISLKDFNKYQALSVCELSRSWFCIFIDNSEHNLKQFKNLNFNNQDKYKWPEPFQAVVKEDKLSYRMGDPIMLYNNFTKDFEELGLPFSIIGSTCQVTEPVRFLKNINRKCLQNIITAQQYLENIIQKLLNMEILQAPLIDEEAQTALICLQPYILCLKPNIMACFNNKCNPIDKNNATAFIKDKYFIDLQISILHNYTNVIENTFYFFTNQSNIEKDTKVWQTFQVIFSSQNETISELFPRSGNFGYLSGKPVIKSKYTEFENKENSKINHLAIDYFQVGNNSKLSSLKFYIPITKSGYCAFDEKITINFDENLRTYCTLHHKNKTELLAETNFTELCNDIQNNIFNILVGNDNLTDFSYTLVSEFGSPMNDSKKWIKLQVANLKENQILGFHNKKLNTFTCQNMILNMKYEFWTVSLSDKNFKHQKFIKRTSIIVGRQVILEFKLNELIKLPLFLDIMFYDIGEESNNALRPNIILILLIILVGISYNI